MSDASDKDSGGTRKRRPKRDRDSFFEKHGRGQTPAEAAPAEPSAADAPADAAVDATPAPTANIDAGDLPPLPETVIRNGSDDLPTTVINPVDDDAPAGGATRRDVRTADDTVVTEPFTDTDPDDPDATASLGAGRRVSEHLTQDPLPYIEPQHTKEITHEETPLAYAEAPEPEPVHLVADTPKVRRGTLDLGLLILRLMIGAVFVLHGLQHLFGWWNGPGINGFTAFLQNDANTSLGFHTDWAKPLAYLTGITETAGGALMILGILTPIAGAGLLGVMISAILYKSTLAGGLSFFIGSTGGGEEYEYVLAAAAAALILTGPGLYSADRRWGWSRRPAWGSFAWLLIGIGAAVAIWVTLNGSNPFPNLG
ncbi:MAG: DoxX family protein [Gordonia sp. (in: high G+C Gram-positive bacteria)]|uniref:DoxX family protein n=1 Tax=Gordonia sp. (in: high G+C Gram-positive bacteria) TaxID=84139 RepID=UPI0039E5A9E7